MKKASVEIRVPFADLDGMRSLFHINYIKYFDLARTKLFREVGIQMEKWEECGILLPLVVCNCDFKKGAAFDTPLRITAFVTEVKGKVITIEYEIVNTDTDQVISTGLTKQVFCDSQSKPFVLQDVYPEIYAALIA